MFHLGGANVNGIILLGLSFIAGMKVKSESVSHSVESDFLYCSPPGSSVYGILQARTLEWVCVYFSRGSSRLRV